MRCAPRAELQKCGLCSWGREGIRGGPTGDFCFSSEWPLCWRVTSFYSTGPSSLLSSSECWNFHCSLMFQPVNTHIFHPSWGSSFGRAFLRRSLELIILYFILLYKQHSLAKEHNHKKEPLLGRGGEEGLKKKEKHFHVQSSVDGIFHSLFSPLPSHKIRFTWPFCSLVPLPWVSALTMLSPWVKHISYLQNEWWRPVLLSEIPLFLFSLGQTHNLSRVMVCVSSRSVTESTVPHTPRELSATHVCAKARMIGFLPIEGMLVKFGNVSQIAGWTSYQGLGKVHLGMFRPSVRSERSGSGLN